MTAVALFGDVQVVQSDLARPHPGATLRPNSIKEENAADHDAILQYVVIVIAPLTGLARSRGAFEDQRS
jgi:hypothetical protein